MFEVFRQEKVWPLVNKGEYFAIFWHFIHVWKDFQQSLMLKCSRWDFVIICSVNKMFTDGDGDGSPKFLFHKVSHFRKVDFVYSEHGG